MLKVREDTGVADTDAGEFVQKLLRLMAQDDKLEEEAVGNELGMFEKRFEIQIFPSMDCKTDPLGMDADLQVIRMDGDGKLNYGIVDLRFPFRSRMKVEAKMFQARVGVQDPAFLLFVPS